MHLMVFLPLEKEYNKSFFQRKKTAIFFHAIFEKSELKKFHLALRRVHTMLLLLNKATNFIFNVLCLPLDRRLPKNSGEGRCTLHAVSLIKVNLFFAICYQQHLLDGCNKRSSQGQRTTVTQLKVNNKYTWLMNLKYFTAKAFSEKKFKNKIKAI